MKPGDSISRYRILGPLGRGGMGVVYRAEDSKLNREVALKFLPGDSITEQDKQRFLNEARIAAAARHPNICPIYDIDEADGRLFIAMALLDGVTLQHKLAAGPMGVPQALAVAGQIASGLQYAHSLGIVHRDIKCSNIMVGPGGHVSIMDFGLALRPGTERLTAVGGTVGTPAYMSPEQAQGLAVDRRSDIWSLGVVMFEMLTGQLPFRREHSSAVVHAIISEPAPDLAALRPGIPADLNAIVTKALAKRPEDRWQSAEEMAAALQRVSPASGDAVMDATQTMTLPAMAVARKPRRVWLVVAGLGAAGLAGGFGYLHFRPGPTGESVPAAAPTGRQVAVLPFDVPGADENTHTISDGLEEVLTDAISSRSADLISVPVSEIRRRKIATVKDARQVYGVAYAVTGSAKPEASGSGKLEFTLSVTDAASGKQTGSEMFVYDPAHPIASRDEAVAVEMRLLKVDLTPALQTAVHAGDTAAPEAYTEYLKGRGLLVRYDVPGNREKAMELFASAVKFDPNYALAWAGLGEAELRQALDSGDKKWSMAAIRDAEHAVKLDPSLTTVHSVLGKVYASAGREEDAIRELQKAIAIAPGNAEAPRELAMVYNNLGRFKEAEASYLQATGERPTDWYGHFLLALFYYGRERYSDAEAELKKAAELTPDNDVVFRNQGSILNMQGRYKEAIEQYQHSLKIRPNDRTYAALGAAYYYEHRYDDAVAAVETAIDLNSSVYFYWGNAGIYYKWAKGSEQKSVPSLRRAIELGLKNLEATPADYSIRADLAEYNARLGNAQGAVAELNKIPPSARKPLASRMAIVYELTGKRTEAIGLIRENLLTKASLNQIRDDPDLLSLWNSSEMRQVAAAAR